MWISRRVSIAAFGLSLLLNLALIGVVAGRYLADTRGPMFRNVGQLVSAARVRALPDADRARYRATTAEHRASIAAARQIVRSARQKVQDAIAASTFDRTEVEADLAALRDASTHLQAAVHAALVDATEDLPAASRATLVAEDVKASSPTR
jgi:uncharacterized membrane protein